MAEKKNQKKPVKKKKAEYMCAECGADVGENDENCPKCGEPLFDYPYDGWLVSDELWKRSLAVLGHAWFGYLIIAGFFLALMLVFAVVEMVASL